MDLWRENVAHPQATVIDINRLPLTAESSRPRRADCKIGALVTNSAAAYDPTIMAARYPLLSKAILAGASPQIRNVASVGGNLLQRTRCLYFYDAGTRYNKREPGTGCPAVEGVNRMHAILGASEHCIAVHPSRHVRRIGRARWRLHLSGPDGSRVLPFAGLPPLARRHARIDTNIARRRTDHRRRVAEAGLRGTSRLRRKCATGRRMRSRWSPLHSGSELDGDIDRECALRARRRCAQAPWRNTDAEASLRGKPLSADTVRNFATDMLRDARGRRGNAFKIELTARAIETRASRCAAQRSLEEHAR